ncbi:MAG: HDOD domain-containing protein [Sandaracinus sp.]|nr:HDOD domain-containing protein [Sandaracinus sp.]MCB9635532.1 HDOD domain-containing protein [Sandaracinus sp.]
MTLAGRVLARYRLVTELGSGGMGSVWFAEHVSIGRRAAIKVLDPMLARDDGLVERFFDEARAVNAIRHPNIVDVVDCAREEDCCFLVMELLEGETLGARLERGPLGLEETVAFVRQIAAALDAVHTRGMVHRDLKPENVFLVNRDRQSELVKVLDFGIVKLVESSTQRTSQGTLLGTPAYMSPEQCSGRTSVDARSDLYSLGVLIFEALTGRLPFERESTLQLLVAHQLETPPNLCEFRTDAPSAVGELVARALAKSPVDRPQSATEMAEALADALRDLRAPKPARDIPPTRRVERSTVASTMAVKAGARTAPAVAPHPERDLPRTERSTVAGAPRTERSTVAGPRPGAPRTERSTVAGPRPAPVQRPSVAEAGPARSPSRPREARHATQVQDPRVPRADRHDPGRDAREPPRGPGLAVLDAPAPVKRGQARRVGSRLVDIVEARVTDGRLVLPAMPEICVECLAHLDARQPLARVATVAGRDPLLTARLLRVANSTASSSRARIVDVESALVRIGTEAFRVLLVEVAARGVFLSRDPRVRAQMRAIWEEAQAVSSVAGRLADRVDPDRRGAAKTAGLLRDVGRPILAALIVEVERQLHTGTRSWMSAEVFGAIVDKHNATIAQRVAEHWRLPDETVEAIVGRDEGSTLAQLVALAHALVRLRNADDVSETRRLEACIAHGVARFGLAREELDATLPLPETG